MLLSVSAALCIGKHQHGQAEPGVQPVKLAGAGRVVCQFAKFVATRGKHVLSRNYPRPIRLTPSLKASLPLCHGSRGQGPSSLFARLGRVCPPANRIGRTGGGPTNESGWPPWPPWDFSGFFVFSWWPCWWPCCQSVDHLGRLVRCTTSLRPCTLTSTVPPVPFPFHSRRNSAIWLKWSESQTGAGHVKPRSCERQRSGGNFCAPLGNGKGAHAAPAGAAGLEARLS